MSNALYVANGDDSLSVLCPETGLEAARITLTAPEPLGASAPLWFGGSLWVLCPLIHSVGAYCPRSGKFRTAHVGACPVALARYQRKMLCACADTSSLWVLSRNVHAEGVLPTAEWPCALCPHGRTVWVGHTRRGISGARDGRTWMIPLKGTITSILALSDASLLVALVGDKGSQLHHYGADGTPLGMLALRGWPTSLVSFGRDTVLVGLMGQGVWAVNPKRMKQKGRLQCMRAPLAVCRDTSAIYVLGEGQIQCIGVDGRLKWQAAANPNANGICLH